MLFYVSFQVSFARPSSESIKFSNLYISNLPRSMTQQELESLFADCGCIISSKILCNPKAGRLSLFVQYDLFSRALLRLQDRLPGIEETAVAQLLFFRVIDEKLYFGFFLFKVHRKVWDLFVSINEQKLKLLLVNLMVLFQKVCVKEVCS